MATLVRMPRAVWRRQPTNGVSLNTSNAFYGDLHSCVVFSGSAPFDLVTEKELVKTGTGSVTSVVTSSGKGLQFGDVDGYTYYTIPLTGLNVSNQTVLWIGQSPPGVIVRDATISDGSILVWNNTNQVDVRLGGSNYNAGGAWTDNQIKMIMVVNSSSSAKVYDDTGLIISDTPSGTMPLESPYHLHRNGLNNGGVLATSVLLIIWKTALNDPSILENPWQLFKPRPARFILIPDGAGGGLSAYQDSTYRWNTLESVQNDAVIRWNTLSSIQQDVALRWNLLTPIQQDSLLRWNSTEWGQNDSALRWNQLAEIQNDVALRWNELSSTEQDAILRWDALSNVLSAQQDVALRWNTLSQTQQDLIARWNLTNSIEQSFSARWNATQSVEFSAALRWQIAESVASDLLLRWDELGQLSATQDLVLQWDLLETTQRDVMLRWTLGDGVQSLPLSTLLIVMAEDRILVVH